MSNTEKVREARRILETRKPAAELLDDLLELLTGSRNTLSAKQCPGCGGPANTVTSLKCRHDQ